MIDHQTAPFAALGLRVSLGAPSLAHAGLKFFVFTPAGTAGFFESLGLPGFLGVAAIAVGAVAGIALILGVGVRWASLALLSILLGGIIFVHGARAGEPGFAAFFSFARPLRPG